MLFMKKETMGMTRIRKVGAVVSLSSLILSISVILLLFSLGVYEVVPFVKENYWTWVDRSPTIKEVSIDDLDGIEAGMDYEQLISAIGRPKRIGLITQQQWVLETGEVLFVQIDHREMKVVRYSIIESDRLFLPSEFWIGLQ